MTDEQIRERTTELTGFRSWQVKQVLGLLDEGATIPFIARYRKDKTGNLDETQIENIRDTFKKVSELEKRRHAIIESIREQGKLDARLLEQLTQANTLQELEDLYLPYKPRKKTRADMAVEKGLEPLANLLQLQRNDDPEMLARRFVNADVKDTDEALQGARDIIADRISSDARLRNVIRHLFEKQGTISARVVKGKEEAGEKFRDYFSFSESVKRLPSHRIMALLRGQSEGILKLKAEPDVAEVMESIHRRYVRGNNACAKQVQMAAHDAWKRLLHPSLESELFEQMEEKAGEDAIGVFALNLRQLLMAPPLREKRVMAIDPGFRTGCKVVCLDAKGDLQYHFVIYPHEPQKQWKEAGEQLFQMQQKYGSEAVAVGNGTAGRETEALVREFLGDRVMVFVTDESGASVYSASEAAREEFPNHDITVRGSVSIGRRLLDPLAELVKIDPKSIGVGQYQHDVNQVKLREKLDSVVESCVNAVGVNLNTASRHLLTYVAGLGPQLAANIVKHREQHGFFRNRKQLMEVPKLGPRTYEQCAGFLRIHGGDDPLDSSAVHPEKYSIVRKMAKDIGVPLEQLVGNKEMVARIQPEKYREEAGAFTLQDILTELARPGLDPRGTAGEFSFDSGVKTMDDLIQGAELPGIVTNITDFGVFVDIGVKQDGLVHISMLSDRFVKHPSEVVKLRQAVKVKVLECDVRRKRISLSMRGVPQGS